MTVVALSVLALVLLPGIAAACPSCLSSAYGDRTFNWAFLGLILMPFVVSAAVGGVLVWKYRWSRLDSPRTLGPEPRDVLRLAEPSLEETT